MEVVDLLNEDVECDSLYNHNHPNLLRAFGGRVNDDYVFCGGTKHSYFKNLDKCYIMGESGPIENLTLTVGRESWSGGLVLPNNTIFIAGMYKGCSKKSERNYCRGSKI